MSVRHDDRNGGEGGKSGKRTWSEVKEETGLGEGGKRTLSEAKEEAGWGEGAPWGKRQWQIASLMAQASGQENERWSTAQVGRGPWVVVSVDGLDMSFSQTFIYVTASDVRWWRVDGGRLGRRL